MWKLNNMLYRNRNLKFKFSYFRNITFNSLCWWKNCKIFHDSWIRRIVTPPVFIFRSVPVQIWPTWLHRKIAKLHQISFVDGDRELGEKFIIKKQLGVLFAVVRHSPTEVWKVSHVLSILLRMRGGLLGSLPENLFNMDLNMCIYYTTGLFN